MRSFFGCGPVLVFAQFPAGRLRSRFRGPSGGTYSVPVPSLGGCAVPRAPEVLPPGGRSSGAGRSSSSRSSPRPFGAPTWGCRSGCGLHQPGSGFKPLSSRRRMATRGGGRESLPADSDALQWSNWTCYRACRIEDGESRPAPTRRTGRVRPKGARGTARNPRATAQGQARRAHETQGREEPRTHRATAQKRSAPSTGNPGARGTAPPPNDGTGTSASTRQTSKAQAKASTLPG